MTCEKQGSNDLLHTGSVLAYFGAFLIEDKSNYVQIICDSGRASYILRLPTIASASYCDLITVRVN